MDIFGSGPVLKKGAYVSSKDQGSGPWDGPSGTPGHEVHDALGHRIDQLALPVPSEGLSSPAGVGLWDPAEKIWVKTSLRESWFDVSLATTVIPKHPSELVGLKSTSRTLSDL